MLSRLLPGRVSIAFATRSCRVSTKTTPVAAAAAAAAAAPAAAEEQKVPLALIKALRERTQAGVQDCKKALLASSMDVGKATRWLELKNSSMVAKKAGRVAVEGLVAVTANSTSGAAVELNCETDFVARVDTFKELAAEIARAALFAPDHFRGNLDVQALQSVTLHNSEKTVSDAIASAIAKLGENIQLRRAHRITGPFVAICSHGAPPGTGPSSSEHPVQLGRFGVLVGLDVQPPAAAATKVSTFAGQLAQHVMALSPQCVRREDLSAEQLQREVDAKQAREQAAAAGVDDDDAGGGEEEDECAVLVEQRFFANSRRRVGQQLEELAIAPTAVHFVRYEQGEGIVRAPETNLAEEVASLLRRSAPTA